MLGAHPRLVCGPETHFYRELPEDPGPLCQEAGWPGSAIDYLYSIRHVGESIPANYGLTRHDLTEALAELRPSVASILSGMIGLYAKRLERPRWVEKTPDHLPHVTRIRRDFPESPILRIVRDPRAVAASLMAVPWGPTTVFEALELWRHHDARSARFFQNDRKAHTIRYEDLVADPETVLRGISRAIGEEFEPSMLETSRSAARVNAAQEPWKTRVAERVDASRAGAWRESLDEDDIRLAEAWLGDRIQAYGYPLSGFAFPHYIEACPRSLDDVGPEGYGHLGGPSRDEELLGRSIGAVRGLVASGGRFWGEPGERPVLSLFLGSPNGWLGRRKYARTARLSAWILRRRLEGIPLAWAGSPVRRSLQGRCVRMVAGLLPPISEEPDMPVLAAGPDSPAGEFANR